MTPTKGRKETDAITKKNTLKSAIYTQIYLIYAQIIYCFIYTKGNFIYKRFDGFIYTLIYFFIYTTLKKEGHKEINLEAESPSDELGQRKLPVSKWLPYYRPI